MTKYPPLWTKPAASLADPGEDIPLDEFCALSFPDYEGELVFVTSRDAKKHLSRGRRLVHPWLYNRQ
jgi:2-keto-4-pentenoate hydratase/2-oxohepta-3-ene-1,7-dioic acid hydratase in catechol pathway